MSYEKTLDFNEEQDIDFEYELQGDKLVCTNWKLIDFYKGNGWELVPDRETAEEIENFIANWLEKEYSKNAMNYISDMQDCLQEKRWEK